MRLAIILLILFTIGCKEAELADQNSNIITDPALMPEGAVAIIDGIPICEVGDHSCRTYFEGTIATKSECAQLDEWQLGDPEIFYMVLTEGSANHLHIGPEGASWYAYQGDDEWLESEIRGRHGYTGYSKAGGCQINIDNGIVTNTFWYEGV